MEEMPLFQKMYNEYKDDIEIIIVDNQMDPGEVSIEKVLEWYDKEGYTFPMVFDEDNISTKEFYNYIQGYPTTFVFAEDGSFIGKVPGAMNEEMMIEIIKTYATK